MSWRSLRRDVWKRVPMLGLVAALTLGALTLQAGQPGPMAVSWQTLQTLNFSLPLNQQKAAALALNGKRVTIPGFMVPLQDDLEHVTQFLLVPFAGACIHVPPPPPNQIVFVEMKKATVQVTWSDPIQVTGTLNISAIQSPYGAVSYDLKGETVQPYQPQ